MKTRYQIGQQFYEVGRDYRRLCTVEDIYVTHNSAGDRVKVSYVASHSVGDQKVLNRDVCETDIAISLFLYPVEAQTERT